jgi:hypothetical protein
LFLTPAGRKLRDQALDIPTQLACASACELDELVTLTQRLHELRAQFAKASGD